MNGPRKNGGRMKGQRFTTKRCKMTLKQEETIHRTNIDYLDDYLLTKILVRLPSETLLDLKIISKRWYSLISDPSFVNKHTGLQTERNVFTFFTKHFNQDATHILDHNHRFYGTIGQLSFDHSSLNFSENPLLLVKKSEEMEVTIVACCHGLLLTLLRNGGRASKIGIFNPLTKKKRIIPLNKKGDTIIKSYGFAFGAKSSIAPGNYYNHYNVVCLVATETAFVFKIFSPETGKWRDSNETTIIKYREGLVQRSEAQMPVCLRGVVYWPIGLHGYIIAFNVVKEESRAFQIPESVVNRATAHVIKTQRPWGGCWWLGVVEDELNQVVVNPKFEIEFWVLHNYEWKLKRKEVMKRKVNLPTSIILCDGERLFFQAKTRMVNRVMEHRSYVYNIRTGVSRKSAFKWGSWFPCVSTLAEV